MRIVLRDIHGFYDEFVCLTVLVCCFYQSGFGLLVRRCELNCGAIWVNTQCIVF